MRQSKTFLGRTCHLKITNSISKKCQKKIEKAARVEKWKQMETGARWEGLVQ